MEHTVSRTVHLANDQRPTKTLCGEAREAGKLRRPVHTRLEKVTCRDCLHIDARRKA